MAQLTEKRLYAVPPTVFTADGDSDGTVKVANASLFTVKQHVHINATGLPTLVLEVKRITDAVTLYVGPIKGSIETRQDLSLYTVASGANISANEQNRPNIPEQAVERATYQDEPVVARRVFVVDKLGDAIDANNPFPVDATVVIPPDLAVRITAYANDPAPGDLPSSVRISDGTNQLTVNPDGSINVNITTSATEPGLQILHNEVTSVASGVETTVATLVGSPSGYRVEKIEVSGDNYAIFRVKLNGTTIVDKRTWWCNFNETFNFENFTNGLFLASGQTLTVTALHNRPYVGGFEATVMYLN